MIAKCMLLLSSVLLQPCAVDPIGLRYRELPPGFKSGASALIDSHGEQLYGLAEVECSDRHLLLLQRVHKDDAGKAHYEVVNLLEVPRLADDEDLRFGSLDCRVAGEYDPEVVAVATTASTDVRFLTSIRLAWRASKQLERFESTPVDGIDCENPNYGL